MSMTFTKEQQEAIDLRDCNILVSAAAGSGKTAVLTERIVDMVCDEEHPVDIDRLLVVTFTSAAAAEMRERIGKKLSERLAEHPESEYLQRQITLLYHAQITTIDSFCLFLIRNHFNEIGLDPAFRVLDEREVKLISQEAMAELLEDAYAEGKPEFLNAVEALCPKGKDKVLEEHIFNLSRYAASFPWPEEWLLMRKEDYAAKTAQEFKKTAAWQYAEHYVRGMIQGCVDKLGQGIKIVQKPDGPYMYGELLDNEKKQFEALLHKKDLEEIGVGLEAISFGRLPSKKDNSVSQERRDEVKGLRDEVKKILSDLKEQFFAWPIDIMLKRGQNCEKVIDVLVDLVLDFNRRVKEKKQEKKGIDFTDMEHFALDILLRREGEEIVPSQVAKLYRDYFQEVLIDEYQDSNLVQEFLLKAVSGEEDGRFDRFMVGDVKQSIYRFRLARPELFLEKYHAYQKEGKLRRIDLSKNFRSRKTVIHTVNSVFERVMSEEVGGMAYDENAALHVGADYPEQEGMESELLAVEKPEKGDEIRARQAEALAVATRIKELMRDGKVTDKESGALRSVRYGDIVILLRSLSGWGDLFKETLEEQGIPAYVTSKSGYFTATEVQNLLCFLKVIDNPYQDIPLYGVLHSVFGGLSDEEIARIRGAEKKLPLFEQLLSMKNAVQGEGVILNKDMFQKDGVFRNEGAIPNEEADQEEKVIGEKVSRFLEKLQEYRDMATYMPTRALLEKITWDHDYLNYVTALPGGTKRRANIEMLFVKASDFEKTSYYGLFHFVRYMEQLEKYEEDYGEAETMDENADVVRIMSIHKSKGLEFPIVFVSGLAKSFNFQDVRQAVILDMDLGLGMDYVDGKKRIKGKTLRKNAVAQKLKEDTLAEELRLFYVALTRAKEKLILSAEMDGPEETIASALESEAGHLSYSSFMKAGNYLDFLLPILKHTGISHRVFGLSDLRENGEKEQLDFALAKKALESVAGKADQEMKKELEKRLEFQYPFLSLKELYTKTTVSELKIAAMEEKDEGAFHLFEEKGQEDYVPEFRREKGGVPGSVRGDAYHRTMELLDYQQIFEKVFPEFPESMTAFETKMDADLLKESLVAFLKKEVQEQRLSEEYYGLVRAERICEFLRAEIGYRMWKAFREGKLHREQPFVLAIQATRLKSEFPEEEKVLIQGIIDAYFVEQDGIVLLDYKTDSVKDEDALWSRYETQLDYYREALERLTQIKVKERAMYAFHLGKLTSKS